MQRIISLLLLILVASSPTLVVSNNLATTSYATAVRRGCVGVGLSPLNDPIISSRRGRRASADTSGAATNTVVPCVAGGAIRPPSLANTLARGALLRVTSDLVGGTAFENVKTRVTTTRESMLTATSNIIRSSGLQGLYSGGSSRFVEGALVGAVFMFGSALTKRQLQGLGCAPTVTALCAGLVGGISQALIMTPAGMIFTTLNVERSRGNYDENPMTVTSRIVQERGGWGMYSGFKPMAIRQASNWASRAGITEIARSVLGLQRFGLVGELGSGILGGVGSCWNTPIETIRVLTQRDLSMGVPTKSITGYWTHIYENDGVGGLFRGVSPRILQAVWQTCFLVVVPNLMGI